jgi:DNA-binding NarL/FixJ family response regulator
MTTFLIADDSPQKMNMLYDVVERHWKGKIVQATTTEGAMDMIDKTPDISAAFIDYYIPSKRGPAIIEYLKERRPHAHIALVSSADNQSNTEEAMAAGAEAFVCTTWQSDTVERELARLVVEWADHSPSA